MLFFNACLIIMGDWLNVILIDLLSGLYINLLFFIMNIKMYFPYGINIILLF